MLNKSLVSVYVHAAAMGRSAIAIARGLHNAVISDVLSARACDIFGQTVFILPYFFPPFLLGEMAVSALKNHLQAVASLLASMKLSSCFKKTVADQKWCVEHMISNTDLTVKDAADVSEQLKAMPWPEKQLDELLKSVNARVGPLRSHSIGQSKLQNFEELRHYFTDSQWNFLRSEGLEDEMVLQGIVLHLKELGLVHASEQTVQAIVAFFLSARKGSKAAMEVPAEVKLEYVKHVKAQLKKYVGRETPACFVAVLPESPKKFQREFPDLYKVAFSTEAPCLCKLDSVGLSSVTRSVPLRKTSKLLTQLPGASSFSAVSPQSSGSDQWQQLVLMMMAMQNSSKPLQDLGSIKLLRKATAAIKAPEPVKAALVDEGPAEPDACEAAAGAIEELEDEDEETPPLKKMKSAEPLPTKTSGKKSGKSTSIELVTKRLATSIAARPGSKVKLPTASKSKIKKSTSPATKNKKTPGYSVERSRSQVMCRTEGLFSRRPLLIPLILQK